MWILDPTHLSTSPTGSSCDGLVVYLQLLLMGPPKVGGKTGEEQSVWPLRGARLPPNPPHLSTWHTASIWKASIIARVFNAHQVRSPSLPPETQMDLTHTLASCTSSWLVYPRHLARQLAPSLEVFSRYLVIYNGNANAFILSKIL